MSPGLAMQSRSHHLQRQPSDATANCVFPLCQCPAVPGLCHVIHSASPHAHPPMRTHPPPRAPPVGSALPRAHPHPPPPRARAGGHYTADVLQGDGKWLRFNDAVVDMVNEKAVLAERPYLLFYQRVRS